MRNITNDYTEILQDFRKLPNADRYTLKWSELSELLETIRYKPFKAFDVIGYAWHRGFEAGIRYAQRHQKRAENNDRDPKCDPFHEKSA